MHSKTVLQKPEKIFFPFRGSGAACTAATKASSSLYFSTPDQKEQVNAALRIHLPLGSSTQQTPPASQESATLEIGGQAYICLFLSGNPC